MKWQSFGQWFSFLALGAFACVVTTGCEPQAPGPVDRENPPAVDGGADTADDGVTNNSDTIDTDPDMEPNQTME